MVELVVTIVLLALTVIPILSAVRGAVKASAVSYQAAAVETALVNAAEGINRTPLSCDSGAYDDVVAAGVPDRAVGSLAVTAVERWGGGGWVPGHCPAAGLSLDLVQRVRLTVTSAGGELNRSIYVVKTNV